MKNISSDSLYLRENVNGILSRRAFLGASASSLLLLPGCLLFGALARVILGRGLAVGLARGSVSRAAALTSTIGRTNAVASRAFSASRIAQRNIPRNTSTTTQQNQNSNSVSARNLFRTAQQLNRLEKISILDEGDQDTEISAVTEVDSDTVKCSIYSRNSEILCWKKNEDLLVHYDISGEAAGSTRIENEFEHVHFVDPTESIIIGRDKFEGGRMLHFRGKSELIGTSAIEQEQEVTRV